MITFSGPVSEVVQKKVLKKSQQQLGLLLFAISMSAFVSILIMNIFIPNVLDKNTLLWCIIAISVSIFTAFAPISKKQTRFTWNFTIQIDHTHIHKKVCNGRQELEQPIPLSKIKKVIDAGEFYYVIWKDISTAYICQKNLLINGSIDEFEAMFTLILKK